MSNTETVYLDEYARVLSELKAAREENERLMSTDYFSARCKALEAELREAKDAGKQYFRVANERAALLDKADAENDRMRTALELIASKGSAWAQGVAAAALEGGGVSFAAATSVPVGRTQDEIKRTLEKYGATGFMFGESGGQALVAFEMKSRRVKFVLDLPVYGKTKSPGKNWLVSEKDCAQKTRSSWRCLLLAIKAKLECQASGISTFEQEFMAHIVMPNGQTIGQAILPQIDHAYKTGNMPPLLGPGANT
jgi:hypothetical protein